MKLIVYLSCLSAIFYAGAMEQAHTTTLTLESCLKNIQDYATMQLAQQQQMVHSLAEYIASHMGEFLILYPNIRELLKSEGCKTLAVAVRNNLLKSYLQGEKQKTKAQQCIASTVLNDSPITALLPYPWYEEGAFLTGHRYASVCLRNKHGKSIRLFSSQVGSPIIKIIASVDHIIAIDEQRISIWDAHNGKKIKSFYYGESETVAQLFGETLLLGGAQKLMWYDMKNLGTKHIFEGGLPFTAAAGLDETHIAFAQKDSSDGKIVNVRNMQTGETKFLEGHAWRVYDIVSLGNGRILTTSHDDTVRVWNTATGSQEHCLQGFNFHKIFPLSDDLFATIHPDGTVKLYSFDGEYIAEVPYRINNNGKALAANAGMLLVAHENCVSQIPTSFDTLLQHEEAVLTLSPVLKELTREQRIVLKSHQEILTLLLSLMKNHYHHGYTGQHVAPFIIKQLIDEVTPSKGNNQKRYAILCSLLELAVKLKLPLIEASTRFFLCNYVHNKDVSERALLPLNVDLKNLGCYGVITSDHRFFLLDKECARLVPYLQALFEGGFKESSQGVIYLNSVSSKTFDLIKKLLATIYRNKISHASSKDCDFYVPQKKLMKVLEAESDIPLEAILTADEWCQHQIAHALIKRKIAPMTNEELADFIQRIPDCLDKYIAPEIEINPDYLEWHSKKNKEARSLHLIPTAEQLALLRSKGLIL